MFKYAPSTRIAMRKNRKLLPKFLPCKRELHKTYNLSAPNDQDVLLEKAIQMEEKWDVIDREIEKVTKTIQDEDSGNSVDDEETYLHQYLATRQNEKDELVSKLEEIRTSAIVEDRDRDSRLAFLDIVEQTTKRDIETLEFVEEQLGGHEDGYEEVVRLLEELRGQETSVAALIEEFHENDLPPIASTKSDDETQNSDKRSNIDDYSDTSTEMPSYMDPED